MNQYTLRERKTGIHLTWVVEKIIPSGKRGSTNDIMESGASPIYNHVSLGINGCATRDNIHLH